MELYAADVQFPVTQCHDLSLIAFGCDLQTGRKTIFADDPGVITSHDDAAGQTAEHFIVAQQGAFCRHAVKDIAQVFQFGAEHFADRLMPQTNAQDRFLARVSLDDVEQQTCLGRDARSGTEEDLIERLQITKLE